MKITTFKTHNIIKLETTIKNLENRAENVPGLGVVLGRAGLGKTRAVEWYSAEYFTPFIRALELWTPRWMLQDMCKELDAEAAKNRARDLFDLACTTLSLCNKAFIIDDADYLDKKLLNIIRDLHDLTKVPFILVGTKDLYTRALRNEPFWSRISQIVEFEVLTPPEIMAICKEWLGLEMNKHAAEAICNYTAGDFRRVAVAFYLLEKAAQANRKQLIDKPLVEVCADQINLKKRSSRKR